MNDYYARSRTFKGVLANVERNCLSDECRDDSYICEECMYTVAINGDIALFKNMVRTHGSTYNGILRGSEGAAEHGYLSFMEYWIEQEYGVFPENICSMAAKSGNVKMLQFMQQKGARWIWRAAAYAAGNGMFDALKYLHSIGAPIDGQAVRFAAANGHQEIVDWLQEIGIQRDPDGIDFMIRRLKWNRNYDNLLKQL